MRKPKIAFLYRKSNKYFTGRHPDPQVYNFYLKALPRSPDIELRVIAEDGEFDALSLEGKCDALLLFDITSWGGPSIIKNLDKVSYLKVLNCGDCHQASEVTPYTAGRTKIDFCRDAKIDYYHWHHPALHFYRFWPKDWKYWSIQMGFEKTTYENVMPFQKRLSLIINSGALTKSRRLRSLVNKHAHTTHNPSRGKKAMVGANYVKLLERYKAGIAAMTNYTVTKYLEVPAAGCLAFMEVTTVNGGSGLGFIDGQSSVFINESNFSTKFDQFIRTIKDPKWESIAFCGRKYAMSRYTNDHTVAELIDNIKDVL